MSSGRLDELRDCFPHSCNRVAIVWISVRVVWSFCFFFQAEDGIRDLTVTGVQTCALPILQAIATAKRLGGVVTGFDVRSVVKEQVQSLGGRFLEVEAVKDAEGEGGYARPLRSEERRGGEEGRSRWAPYHLKKKKKERRGYW